jgi:hypothetical protein
MAFTVTVVPAGYVYEPGLGSVVPPSVAEIVSVYVAGGVGEVKCASAIVSELSVIVTVLSYIVTPLITQKRKLHPGDGVAFRVTVEPLLY